MDYKSWGPHIAFYNEDTNTNTMISNGLYNISNSNPYYISDFIEGDINDIINTTGSFELFTTNNEIIISGNYEIDLTNYTINDNNSLEVEMFASYTNVLRLNSVEELNSNEIHNNNQIRILKLYKS